MVDSWVIRYLDVGPHIANNQAWSLTGLVVLGRGELERTKMGIGKSPQQYSIVGQTAVHPALHETGQIQAVPLIVPGCGKRVLGCGAPVRRGVVAARTAPGDA